MSSKSLTSRLFPFLDWLPLAKKHWKADLVAGLTGTVIVIPQAVAFALIAGMPAEYGFYTAMLTPLIAALFGSSYHLVSGPTTTSSIVLYAIVSRAMPTEFLPENEVEIFVSLAITLSFMAGVVKLIMGVARMGKLVNFVSNSVIIGFAAGAGVLIAFKQLQHIFGVDVPQGSSFYNIISYIVTHISETNWYTFAVAMATFVIALVIKKIKKINRVYMLVAMVMGSVIAWWLGGTAHGIASVGDIPANLPPFNLPSFDFTTMQGLGSGAIILGVLGLVEAAAISRSIALHTHQKLNYNQEFVSQGISNVVSSFFSCYTSSGSFTRSSINYQAGAKTPMSAIVAAFGLMVVVLLFGEYAKFLPKAAMGGIILLVGYNLIDFKHIKQIFKSSRRELIVFGATFLATLFIGIKEALVIGIVLSLAFYLQKTSNLNITKLGLNQAHRLINAERQTGLICCPQMSIVRIDGSIYFGAIEKVTHFFTEVYQENDYVLIVADGINFIDLAGAEWLAHEAEKFRDKGGRLVIAGSKLISQDVLRQSGFYEVIGEENFFVEKSDAIASIFDSIPNTICSNCQVRAFNECRV